MNRSGTKWLSNLLCNHPDVVGAQSEVHTGILETNIFDALPRAFGDVSRVENYIAFAESWAQSDFFAATGAAKELLYEAERPRTYAAVFRRVMADLAERSDARYWLQKVSPLSAERATSWFPDARIFVIRRSMEATLRSTVQLARTVGSDDSVARAVFHYVFQSRLLDRVSRRYDVFELRYEDLREDTEPLVRAACRFIGIEPTEGMARVPFARNTSFPQAGRDAVLSRRDVIEARCLARALSVVPTASLAATWRMLRGKDTTFVRGTYTQLARRYNVR